MRGIGYVGRKRRHCNGISRLLYHQNLVSVDKFLKISSIVSVLTRLPIGRCSSELLMIGSDNFGAIDADGVVQIGSGQLRMRTSGHLSAGQSLRHVVHRRRRRAWLLNLVKTTFHLRIRSWIRRSIEKTTQGPIGYQATTSVPA